MIYGSVCSGIEAATVAWHGLGWKPAFFSDIEDFPRAVLAHHYPDVPCHGDFTTIGDEYGAINLLVGGTPCQAFSVAGLRKGLDDHRGNLTLEFVRLAQRKMPKWLVWENVPGVLSIDGGRAFGSFLGGLAECGYGFAYRVLDAQYFGVPQRRRRVFVVGYLGDWRPPAAVLFERQSLRGDITPSREAREETAGTLGARTCRSIGVQDAECGHLISVDPNNRIFPTIDCAIDKKFGSNQWVDSEQFAYGFNWQNGGGYGNANDGLGITKEGTGPLSTSQVPAVSYGIPGNWIGRSPENGGNAVEPMHDTAPCLTKADRHGVAHQVMSFTPGQLARGIGSTPNEHLSPTLLAQNGRTKSDQDVHVMTHNMAVRRLTPVECERLQGFPDNYTNIPWRGKPTSPDGPRYQALGNSMAVPVMRWIGERIDLVDKGVLL